MRLQRQECPNPSAGHFFPPSPGGEEELWLLGQPPLRRYLEFVEEDAIGGGGADRSALVEEWRAANRYYQQLERDEAGIATQVERREVDAALAPLADEVKAHPWFRRGFDTLPATLAMVQLDRLIVFQKHVSRNFMDELASRLTAAAAPDAVFRFCLPLAAPGTAVQVRRAGSGRYVFRCDSVDFRFHEATLLEPGQVSGYRGFGPIGGIVALVVGFGSNFLNAVAVGKRLMLQNGYHRACALRALGITHAPCIVQRADTIDELELVAKSEVTEDPAFYFESARPPLLKDFFDPRIRKALPVRRRLRQVEVSFEIQDFLVEE